MNQYPKSIQSLIDEFNKLPGIGPKTAERFVFYLLKQPKGELAQLSDTLARLKDFITTCEVCQNFTEKSPCPICSDPKRDHAIICVVAEPQDLIAIEKTGEFKGVYHVLGGVLNPIAGVTPEQLKIKNLELKIKNYAPQIQELILALNPDMEGEATVLYLKNLFASYKINPAPFTKSEGDSKSIPHQKRCGVKITRLARGLPMGSELEYADEVTLSDALKGRREV